MESFAWYWYIQCRATVLILGDQLITDQIIYAVVVTRRR